MNYKEQIDTLNAWGGALTTATGRQIGMYFREAAQSITDLLTRAEIAEYELAQKDEYYEQMTDALAGLSSKELEETKEKLRITMERLAQVEQERDKYKELFFSYKHIYEGLEPEEAHPIVHEIKVCPLCQGRGKLPTWFYGVENCSIEDARNDKFPAICHVCLGRGLISGNEKTEEE